MKPYSTRDESNKNMTAFPFRLFGFVRFYASIAGPLCVAGKKSLSRNTDQHDIDSLLSTLMNSNYSFFRKSQLVIKRHSVIK